MKTISLKLNAEAEALAAEARAFFTTALPDNLREQVKRQNTTLPIEEQKDWHRVMDARGWGGHGLPLADGGPGWDDEVYYAFLREMALADVPRPMLYGLRMLAPTLAKFGTADQKARYLPGIVSGDTMWCQAFSEPNAGSDLAALKCKAVLNGDHYVISGTKIWTTEAHVSDALFGLFRTDSSGRKQAGISFLMMPIDVPGLTIRPLHLLEGTHEVNELHFDDVRVPVIDRLGEEGDGWRLAKFLLEIERLESAEVSRSWAIYRTITEFLSSEAAATRGICDDPGALDQLSKLHQRLVSLDAQERLLVKRGEAALREQAPFLKLLGTPLFQDLAEFLMILVGVPAQIQLSEQERQGRPVLGPDTATFAAASFYLKRTTSIYGGASEVLKDLIARPYWRKA